MKRNFHLTGAPRITASKWFRRSTLVVPDWRRRLHEALAEIRRLTKYNLEFKNTVKGKKSISMNNNALEPGIVLAGIVAMLTVSSVWAQQKPPAAQSAKAVWALDRTAFSSCGRADYRPPGLEAVSETGFGYMEKSPDGVLCRNSMHWKAPPPIIEEGKPFDLTISASSSPGATVAGWWNLSRSIQWKGDKLVNSFEQGVKRAGTLTLEFTRDTSDDVSIQVSAGHDPNPNQWYEVTWVYKKQAPGSAIKLNIQVKDANPIFTYDFFKTTGSDDAATKWGAAMDARATRRGAVADGQSLLLLLAEVPEGSTKAAFSVEGGETNGTLISLVPAVRGEVGTAQFSMQPFVMPPSKAGRKLQLAGCLYRPPKHFGNGDAERSVSIHLNCEGKSGAKSAATREIILARPPVVLVHGTFDNPEYCYATKDIPECQEPMQSFLKKAGFRVFLMDWRESNGQKDPSSFEHNATAVWENKGGIKEALESMRSEGIAATQADVVGHSQGGVIARAYVSGLLTKGIKRSPTDRLHFGDQNKEQCWMCWYHRKDNYFGGDIHRLITISTTHYGSDICRLFEAYRQLRDSKSATDPDIPLLDGLATEFILALHPQRELIVHTKMIDLIEARRIEFERSRGSPASAGYNDLGWLLMLLNGAWQKLTHIKSYAFTEGFRDQTPGSEALKAIGPTRVPSHAIACTADDNDMLTLNKPPGSNKGYYQQRLELMWSVSPALVIRESFKRLDQEEDARELWSLKNAEEDLIKDSGQKGDFQRLDDSGNSNQKWNRLRAMQEKNAARFRSAVFGNAPSDCTVRLESSFGGLAAPYITPIPHALHGPAPQYPKVQQSVLKLLQNDGSLFCAAGFPPAGILPPNRRYQGPDIPAGTTGGSTIRKSVSASQLGADSNDVSGPTASRQTKAPQTIETATRRAWEAMAAADYVKAEKEFREVAELNPDDPRAWLNVGHACLEQNKHGAVAEAARQSLRVAGNDAMIHGVAAQLLHRAGQTEEARAAARRALQLGLGTGAKSFPVFSELGISSQTAMPPTTRKADATSQAGTVRMSLPELGCDLEARNGRLLVGMMTRDCVLVKAGLQPGDEIKAVNKRDVTGMPLAEIVAMLRQNREKNIYLFVARGDKELFTTFCRVP